jgi:hypothetical protein
MPTKVHIVFHSLYTHVYHLAEAVAAGAREVPDTEIVLGACPRIHLSLT